MNLTKFKKSAFLYSAQGSNRINLLSKILNVIIRLQDVQFVWNHVHITILGKRQGVKWSHNFNQTHIEPKPHLDKLVTRDITTLEKLFKKPKYSMFPQIESENLLCVIHNLTVHFLYMCRIVCIYNILPHWAWLKV